MAKAPATSRAVVGQALQEALSWFYNQQIPDRDNIFELYGLKDPIANLSRLKNGAGGIVARQSVAEKLLKFCQSAPDDLTTYSQYNCAHQKLQENRAFDQIVEAIFSEFPSFYSSFPELVPQIYSPKFYPKHEGKLYQLQAKLQQKKVVGVTIYCGEVSDTYNGDSITAKIGRLFIKISASEHKSYTLISTGYVENDLSEEFLLRKEGLSPDDFLSLSPRDNTRSLEGTLDLPDICSFQEDATQADIVEVTTKMANLDVSDSTGKKIDNKNAAAAFRVFLIDRIIPIKENSPILLLRQALG